MARLPSFFALLALALFALAPVATAREGDCEVCVAAVKEIAGKLKGDDRSDVIKTEAIIDKFCAKPSSVSGRVGGRVGGWCGVRWEAAAPVSSGSRVRAQGQRACQAGGGAALALSWWGWP